jgi:cytochrome c oxidase cbb3-type subunit 2
MSTLVVGAPRQAPARAVRIGAFIAAAALVAVLVTLLGRRPPPSGPLAVHYGRDTCAECRMHLTQPGFAAQLRDARGGVEKFDDVGCMVAFLSHTGRGPQDLPPAWVEDHAGGGWIPVADAIYVRGKSVATPMDHGVVAFVDASAAQAFAAEHAASVVTLAQLFEAAPAAPTGAPSVSARAGAGGRRPLDDADATAGKAVYLRECSACHGERGDGQGPAAAFLDPRPRDFTKRKFKLRTTLIGQPPTTADILRTIERGIPGTAMPSFAFLTAEERGQIAAYVLDKANLLDGKEPAPIPDPGGSPPSTTEQVARGKVVYEQLGCATCHGAQGKGDGPSAKGLKDDDGHSIAVRDFTGGVFRGGGEPRDLYYRFVTGLDGTPMPSYADAVKGDDRWALVAYVMSLRTLVEPRPLPKDPLEAGRAVAAKYSCRGCHVLDDGKGGDVGPDLRISGQKLDAAWVTAFLQDPRRPGKIYPWRVSRMPHLGLTAAEAEAMAGYLGAMGKRRSPSAAVPEVTAFDAQKIAEGQGIFTLRCTECHNLGKVIETPAAKQQGPDLIHVAGRVDYDWAKAWISDPKKIDPRTKMTIPGITPAQVDAVRMFVWKASVEAGAHP